MLSKGFLLQSPFRKRRAIVKEILLCIDQTDASCRIHLTSAVTRSNSHLAAKEELLILHCMEHVRVPFD